MVLFKFNEVRCISQTSPIVPPKLHQLATLHTTRQTKRTNPTSTNKVDKTSTTVISKWGNQRNQSDNYCGVCIGRLVHYSEMMIAATISWFGGRWHIARYASLTMNRFERRRFFLINVGVPMGVVISRPSPGLSCKEKVAVITTGWSNGSTMVYPVDGPLLSVSRSRRLWLAFRSSWSLVKAHRIRLLPSLISHPSRLCRCQKGVERERSLQ